MTIENSIQRNQKKQQKTNKRKMDQEYEKCINHNNLIPLSNFIKFRQEILTKLQNVKTAQLKRSSWINSWNIRK